MSPESVEPAAATEPADPALDAWWQALVTTALLGTDRREPPEPPAGTLGDMAADLVADAQAPTPARRLLVSVAAAVVARRAGMVPGPAVTALARPVEDPRPVVPPAAVATWRSLVVDHPVLVDEWLALVGHHGWRLSPDVAVELLVRYRNDGARRPAVVAATGPLAGWLVDHVSTLAPGTRRSAAPGTAPGLPPLPVPPELADLLTADALTVRRRVVAELTSGRPVPVLRSVLTNVIARCRPEVLVDLAGALRSLDATGSVTGPVAGAAWVLAELAGTRDRMRSELDPALRVGGCGSARPS